jgi:hypothetical protein
MLTIHNGLKWMVSFVSFASCAGGVASLMCGCRLRGNLPLSPPYIASVHNISVVFDISACCEPIAAIQLLHSQGMVLGKAVGGTRDR